MYNDTVTIFNRYDSSSGTMWYPTVIKGVNVNMDKASIVAKYGAESKDNVVVNVRYKLSDGQEMIEKKKWLPPKEWAAQQEDSLAGSLTFTSGQDFLYVGDWGSEIPVPDGDSQYGRNGFYNYMNKKYDFVFSITGASSFSVIPHFEIRGA